MDIYALIPLIGVIIYLGLIGFVVIHPLARGQKVFVFYLTVSMLWSFFSFILHANFFPSQTPLWHRTLLAVATAIPVIFYHFTHVFFNKSGWKILALGYAGQLGIIILVMLGGILKSSYVVNGLLFYQFNAWYYLIFPLGGSFMAMALFNLVQGMRRTADPWERNRIAYLLAAISVAIILLPTNFIPDITNLSLDHIGNIVTALIIICVIRSHRLLNIGFVMRRVLAYLILLTVAIFIFTGVTSLGNWLFSEHPLYITTMQVGILALLLMLLPRQLRYTTEEGVDRSFYRETYHYRRELLNFSTRMSNIVNLDELAGAMLPAICHALRIRQVSLLLQDVSHGEFAIKFAYPEVADKPKDELQLGIDNPVVAWLDKEGQPLDLKQKDNLLQFKGLGQGEREKLVTSNLKVLCPIKSRARLSGILGLGEKQANTLYSQEDMELVMHVANQAGIMLENAQLYSQAVMQAITDGLTGLYNHRHFHERLEQEISRNTRFGTVFSLIMLDIDHFKNYNDSYGHLAGDEVLRKIAECVRTSIRTMDMAFRYGGEEFTIILPETLLNDARIVAERVRKSIEARAGSDTNSITASFGVASWPMDGMTKEELIAIADAAMYKAKQRGRNRTCSSLDLDKTEAPTVLMERQAKSRALDVIYALAATVDAKDHYTYGHSKKVSQYAVSIAEALGLPQNKIAAIRTAGLLHDIGKISVPDSILNKKGSLTDEEWQPIKVHPGLGIEILQHIVDLADCLPAVFHHHERYDGSGYPSGLNGDKIPLEARILTIADAYDAITSERPYRQQQSSQEALNELKRCSGTQFDPELVDTFYQTIEQSLTK
ncbi:MAG: diguanylate cyclase and metal-dependent phosphohydrolase [Dehalococcoidales bacterium]|nr:diguanylate cyclase and metal-dependent phosphohydrolase [Dehalococcoidales bacterium]